MKYRIIIVTLKGKLKEIPTSPGTFLAPQFYLQRTITCMKYNLSLTLSIVSCILLSSNYFGITVVLGSVTNEAIP